VKHVSKADALRDQLIKLYSNGKNSENDVLTGNFVDGYFNWID